jgi:hypothetical protein
MEKKDARVETGGLQVTLSTCHQFSLPSARRPRRRMGRRVEKENAGTSKWTYLTEAHFDHTLCVTVRPWC